jgi:restriction endonuclease S subunit
MKKNNLRISILQQAIGGKLVPQLAADGNAQDLVDNIREHKAELIREKKLKKDPNESYIYRDDEGHFMERIGKKEPVCIDDDLPFAVPDGWTWARLGEMINLLSGRDLAPSEYFSIKSGIPYITGASNFKNGEIEINRWSNNPVTISHAGDLLITCKGTIGEMAYNNIGDVHIARQIMAISTEYINISYIEIILKSQLHNLEKKAKSMIPGISRDVLIDFLLPLPPLAEQERIVKKVEELMPLAEKFEKQSEELELLNGALPGKLRKSILQHAIKGLLVPQLAADGNAQDLVDNIREHKAELIREKKLKKDPNESYIYRDDEGHFMERIGKQEPVCIDNDLPFAVPEGWTWARLGEIGEIIPTKQYQILESQIHGVGKIPVVSQSKNQIEGYCDNIENVFVHKNPIVVFGDHTKVVKFIDFDFIVGADGVKIIEPYIDNKYMYFLLKYASGNTRDRGYSRHFQFISNFLYPLPPLAEQERIVKKVEELMEKVDKMEKAMA